MTNRIESEASAESSDAIAGPIAFAPVPRKHRRHDGWTPERQQAFIAALADTACVSRAAAMVGMSSESAYMLRRQPGAEAFCDAWRRALDRGVQRLRDIAFERAIEGVPVPIIHHGKHVGERRHYNDRLLMFTLRHHDPAARAETIAGRVSPSTLKALKAEMRAELEAEIRAEIAAEAETEAGWNCNSPSYAPEDDEEDLAAAREIERRLAAIRARKGIVKERFGPFADHPEYEVVARYISAWTDGGEAAAQAERQLERLGMERDKDAVAGDWWRWTGRVP